ncbi:ACP S-malonyltransferase [Burkholderia metallica]|uniref:ACP S-malonyltransferase n=1 Tax=Burkholderia metallica TaxID=488729 RepID=UPI0015768CAE|nr:acyltransferase domain-containing protein [Burkholderia metallica]NTZ06933.1 acyltransferase domain-containing protein [Burkholderia metallica]
METCSSHPTPLAIYVIPGQGDSPSGALKSLHERSRAARECIDGTFDEIEATLRGEPYDHDPRLLRDVLLGHASAAAPAGIPQLAAFATAVCVHRFLERQQVRLAAIIGQSLGEIASLVCSGVWSVSDGVRAVLALNAAFEPFAGRGGMTAIAASQADTLALLDEIAHRQLVLACVNAPRQTVVSGPHTALDTLAAFASRRGIRLHTLPIPYPAHHPALWAAADRFHDAIARLPRSRFRVPVYSAVACRRYADTDDLPRALADCFTKPYHMPDVLEHSRAAQDAIYVDLSMTGIMTRSIKAALPDVRTYSPTRETGSFPFHSDQTEILQ